MKKCLFIAIAICAFFASCSHDNDSIDGDVNVSFSINLEESIDTRAISDGTGTNQLMYAVFSEGKTIIKKVVKDNIGDLTTGHRMTISLAKGHTYQVVFWAQNSECDAYTVSDDMKVSINYEGLNNDESRDAFFAATEPFRVSSSSSISVVLRRPFAQVNVGTFPYDLEYIQGMGVRVEKSSAVFESIANQIDLLTGEVSGEVNVEYELNDIPTETLYADVDENGVNENYDWLSMSYILAESDRTLKTMSFKFTNRLGYEPINFGELDNVPIQRNYRTNILGQILSGTTSFEIIIDPVYEDDEIYQDELYYNFSEPTTIKNKEFTFNNPNLWVTFTTENNDLLTLENVTFSGKMNQVAIGEYRGRDADDVPYTNVLKNVKAEGVTVGNGIENIPTIDYMSLLFYIRGKSTLYDCVMTGTKTAKTDPVTDYNGDTHYYFPYDCGIPNFSDATFENCTIGSLYAWSHSMITLKNCTVNHITCATNAQKEASHLTIESGTVVEKILVTSSGTQQIKTIDGKKVLTAPLWPPVLTIKAGATVKLLDFNGRPMKDTDGNLKVIIEEGANVNEIVNLAE